MKLVASIAYIFVGIGCIYMLSTMLQEAYVCIAEYVQEKEDEPEYTLEVDVDPETGQRTSTIKRLTDES